VLGEVFKLGQLDGIGEGGDQTGLLVYGWQAPIETTVGAGEFDVRLEMSI